MTPIVRVLFVCLIFHSFVAAVADDLVTPEVHKESQPKIVRATSATTVVPYGQWGVVPGDGGTNLELKIRTNGGPLFVLAKIGGMNVTFGQLVKTRLTIDGNEKSQEAIWHGVGDRGERKLGILQNSVLCALVDDLGAGEHTIQLEWWRERGEADVKVSSGPGGPIASRELIAFEIASALAVSHLQNDVKVKFDETIEEFKKLEPRLGKISDDERAKFKDELRKEISAELKLELYKEIMAELKADPDFHKSSTSPEKPR